MGNGFASFFIMAIQAAILRRPWRETGAILLVGCLATALYFVNYQAPTINGSTATGVAALTTQVKFLFTFLGGFANPATRY